MTHPLLFAEVLNAQLIDGEVHLLVQEFDAYTGGPPYLSRLGTLTITQGYLIEMLKNYRNGDLLSDIVWDEEE